MFLNRWQYLSASLGKFVRTCFTCQLSFQGLNYTLDMLNEGNWCHLFPEGKVQTFDFNFKHSFKRKFRQLVNGWVDSKFLKGCGFKSIIMLNSTFTVPHYRSLEGCGFKSVLLLKICPLAKVC